MTASRFTLERLIESCRAALAGVDAEQAVRELVTEALSDPAACAAQLCEPEHAGFEVLLRVPDLTILHFAWAPWMCFKPHDHCMCSVVGILTTGCFSRFARMSRSCSFSAPVWSRRNRCRSVR